MPFAYKPTDTWTYATRPFGIGKCVPFYTTEIDKSSVAALPPDQDEPGCVAMLVYNDSGSTIAKNLVVARKAATPTARIRVCPSGSDPSLVMGVTLAAIANGSVGFIAVSGQVGITAGAAGITADTRIKVGVADGVAVDSASTDDFAFAHETKTTGLVSKCTLLRGCPGPLADLG
jgi:hypothetical protein